MSDNNVSKKDNDTENKGTMKTPADMSPEAAFKAALESAESDDWSTFTAQFEDSEANEVSTSEDDEQVLESQHVDEQTNAQPDNDRTSENLNLFSQDNQQLYAQLVQEKDAKIQLLHSRLSELSDQYQSLKAEANRKVETPAESAEVQELYDMYPELARALDKIIDNKVTETKKNIEETITPQTLQMQRQLQELAQQNYYASIMRVHPDLPAIAQSGALKNWVNNMSDPTQKAGAEWIMNYGSADQVVNLVSQYKNMQGISAKPVNKNTTQKPNTTNNDELIKRIVNAINVPSNKQEPTLANNGLGVPQYSNEQEAFVALAKEYERGLR